MKQVSRRDFLKKAAYASSALAFPNIILGKSSLGDERVLQVLDDAVSTRIRIKDFSAYNQKLLSLSNGDVCFTQGRKGRDVFVWDHETEKIKNLTNNPSFDNRDPVELANRDIAFVSNKNGNSDIYVCNPKTGSSKQITSSSSQDLSPLSLPNGNIGFCSNRGDISKNTVTSYNYSMNKLSHSKKRRHLHIKDINSNSIKQITKDPTYVCDTLVLPSGKIAYTSLETQIVGGLYVGGRDVFLQDPSTNTRTQITNKKGKINQLFYVPNNHIGINEWVGNPGFSLISLNEDSLGQTVEKVSGRYFNGLFGTKDGLIGYWGFERTLLEGYHKNSTKTMVYNPESKRHTLVGVDEGFSLSDGGIGYAGFGSKSYEGGQEIRLVNKENLEKLLKNELVIAKPVV